MEPARSISCRCPALKFQSVELPNPPAANATGRQNPRANVITDMGFADGRLWVAGLSNEEFASKLRAIPYPFAASIGARASRSITATTGSSRRGRR